MFTATIVLVSGRSEKRTPPWRTGDDGVPMPAREYCDCITPLATDTAYNESPDPRNTRALSGLTKRPVVTPRVNDRLQTMLPVDVKAARHPG